MALVTMRQLLDEAARGGYGVGAFNVNNMEQIQAVMEAASETRSPVIIQASRGARQYTNDRFLIHLREGQPCVNCGTTVRKIVVGGRGTYVCEHCQPRPRSRARPRGR
jgi:fructose/tagatose bisphosphate aldolase